MVVEFSPEPAMFSIFADLDYRFQILGLTVIGVGLAVGFVLGSFRHKLPIALMLMLTPPATFSLMFWDASSSGCSGGSCTGGMILLMIALLPCAGSSLFGFGFTIATLVEMLLARRKEA